MTEVMVVQNEGAIVQQSKGEIAALIDVAHRYPRDEERSIRRAAAMACESEATAQACFYSLPRAGKRVEGGSVRLAEIMASQWGNIHVGTRVLEEGDREIMVEGICIDLESNYRVVIPKRRRITTKEGKRYDDDGITNTVNAAASIAFRDAVFRVIPKVYVNKILEEARTVAMGGAKSMKERRVNAIEYWAKLGIDKKRLLEHLGYKDVDSITVEDLDYLLGLATGIKQKDYDVEDAFKVPRDQPSDTKPKKESATLDMSKVKATKKEEPKPETEPEADLEAWRERIAKAAENMPLDTFDELVRSAGNRADAYIGMLNAIELAELESTIANWKPQRTMEP